MEVLANSFGMERERAGAVASQTEGGGRGHAHHGGTHRRDSAYQNDSRLDGDGWHLGFGSSRVLCTEETVTTLVSGVLGWVNPR
jgi:hypothetical protein